MKPLKKCCNGCEAPTQAPSLVLCKKCLETLNKKMHEILGSFQTKEEAEKALNEEEE